jgi:uracil DNA glycosylase superfamily protein
MPYRCSAVASVPISRIVGGLVPAIFPDSGTVTTLLIGEAPGPRGADKSGVPFWGDEAGKVLYRTLEALGLAVFPATVWDGWDGETLKSLGIKPRLKGVAITNAFGRCPTDNGTSFRSPSDAELSSADNRARLSADVATALARRSGTNLRVVTLGERARTALELLPPLNNAEISHLSHPSRQGLLQAEPKHGKGTKIESLKKAWVTQLTLLLSDGPRAPGTTP